jgi:hypothetical protein
MSNPLICNNCLGQVEKEGVDTYACIECGKVFVIDET